MKFEKEAQKRLGGSMVYVSKKKNKLGFKRIIIFL